MSAAALLEEAVRRGDPPAAGACAIMNDRVVYESAHGCDPDSIFDVASITKLAATTLAIAALIEDGELELDDPISNWIPSMRDITVRELLGHRSGLPAWRAFFDAVVMQLPSLF